LIGSKLRPPAPQVSGGLVEKGNPSLRVGGVDGHRQHLKELGPGHRTTSKRTFNAAG